MGARNFVCCVTTPPAREVTKWIAAVIRFLRETASGYAVLLPYDMPAKFIGPDKLLIFLALPRGLEPLFSP